MRRRSRAAFKPARLRSRPILRAPAGRSEGEDLEAGRPCPPSGTTFGPTGLDEIQKGRVAGGSEEHRPDTQAELANERTYLAWRRTGLALVAAGLGAERILPAEGIIWARQVIGVSLILAGDLTAS